MTEDRKYFGMTSRQIAILAGLAVAFLLLLGVGGWLILGGGGARLAPAPQNTPVPQSTATPFVIPTASLTETLTPVPYEMLIPEDWVQFKTALVEIWLPKEFKSNKAKSSGNATNLGTLDLVLTGVTSKSSTYDMLVIVSYELLTGDSLDAHLTSEIAGLSSDRRVSARSKVSVNSVDAVKLLFERRTNNVDFNELVYVFLDGSTVWYIGYVAQINEFYEMLPTFEQSIKTFRIVR
jgi:hypothetical protein